MNIFFKRVLLLFIILMLASGSVFAGGGGGGGGGDDDDDDPLKYGVDCRDCTICTIGTTGVVKRCVGGCPQSSTVSDWLHTASVDAYDYDYDSNCRCIQTTHRISYHNWSCDCGCYSYELGYVGDYSRDYDTCL